MAQNRRSIEFSPVKKNLCFHKRIRTFAVPSGQHVIIWHTFHKFCKFLVCFFLLCMIQMKNWRTAEVKRYLWSNTIYRKIRIIKCLSVKSIHNFNIVKFCVSLYKIEISKIIRFVHIIKLIIFFYVIHYLHRILYQIISLVIKEKNKAHKCGKIIILFSGFFGTLFYDFHKKVLIFCLQDRVNLMKFGFWTIYLFPFIYFVETFICCKKIIPFYKHSTGFFQYSSFRLFFRISNDFF